MYPVLPNRKEIGLRRAITSRVEKRALARPPRVEDVLPRPGAKRATCSENDVRLPLNGDLQDCDLAPSTPDMSIQQVLIDIYFSRAFNASLTFHRPTVLRQWRASELPQIHLLSMCAMAAR